MKLVVIGDSWTYGSEIRNPDFPEEIKDWDELNDEYRISRIWPTKLCEKLNFDECINLSFPGASNDRSVRILTNWLTQEYLVKNKETNDLFVIIGLTSPERKDFFYSDDLDENERFWVTLWPMWKHKYRQEPINDLSKVYVKNFWNVEEYVNRYLTQILFLNSFLEKHNIRHLFFQSFYQYETIAFRHWADNPYIRDYNSNVEKLLWELIDPVIFVDKNKEKHSFHNYIVEKDRSIDKKISLLDIHPTEIGHTWWAEYLYDYIIKHDIINFNKTPKNNIKIKHNIEKRRLL